VVPPLLLPSFTGVVVVTLVMTLVTAFATEMIFRGAAISRYQADLTRREVLLAATLTPFGWLMVQRLLSVNGPPSGMNSPTEMAMSVFLALLFLRTDSVWLSAGLRAGALVLAVVLPAAAAGPGGPVLWGSAAAILLALEWFRQERMPRRVQSNRRTIRGPWGPH
jgi:membrane protease YdiL (CAAX protease family)